MTDPTLFTAGSLFPSDYLLHGIRQAAEYDIADLDTLRTTLAAILGAFPHAAPSARRRRAGAGVTATAT